MEDQLAQRAAQPHKALDSRRATKLLQCKDFISKAHELCTWGSFNKFVELATANHPHARVSELNGRASFCVFHCSRLGFNT